MRRPGTKCTSDTSLPSSGPNLEEGSLLLDSQRQSTDCAEPELVEVPKRLGGTRLMTYLSPADDDDYRRVVSGVALQIESRLSAGVVANRVTDVRSLSLEPWRLARRRFRRQVGVRTRRGDRVVALTDVRACYASIGVGAVQERLFALGCHPAEVGAVVSVLERFAEHGVAGLPVGPVPSAVLANAVLSVSDQALSAEGIPHVRWVDDVVVFPRDMRTAERALERVAAALGRAGLELSESKTRVVEDPADAPSVLSRLAMSGAYLR